MAEFLLPSLGADAATAHLIEWLVKPGDRVRRGDLMAVIETEKGLIEVESFEDGTVERILIPAEGQELPVGTPLAIIASPGEAPAGPKPALSPPETTAEVTHVSQPEQAPARVGAQVAPPTSAPARAGRVRVSPVARRLAGELGVDLAIVHGTGPGGAIQRSDIERAAAAAAASVPATPAPRVSTPVGSMREAIARAMSRSNREIPHYYLAQDIDMLRASQWLQEANRQRSVTQRLLMAALLIKATAVALREAPDLNGFWVDDVFRPSEAIHVGVAISLRQGGLMTPAIHRTDMLSLDELMPKLRDLVQRVRGGALRSSEITDPTITVTNLGDAGVSEVFGVIYPPQVALVGFGAIADRPVSVDGLLGIRPILTASLSADHRASDGVVGARFLNALSRLLQEPEKL